jgi:hypothetical protein
MAIFPFMAAYPATYDATIIIAPFFPVSATFCISEALMFTGNCYGTEKSLFDIE